MQNSIENMNGKHRVPAYVLVGFLGSGKTTVLGQLIGWCVDNGLKPGLIINEFGDISIDSEAVRQEGLTMTELTNGCLCCTAGEELVPALLEMATNTDVDLILLEATGLADPGDMLDELTDPFLWQNVEVGGIISVVDCLRFMELVDTIALARRQVEYADVLVLNKCDLVREDRRGALETYLSRLAPDARIFQAENGFPSAGVEALLSHSLSIGRDRLQQRATAREAGDNHHDHYEHEDGHDNHHHYSHDEDHHKHHDHENGHGDHLHAHGHAHESIHTMSFSLTMPLEKTRFEQFLQDLPGTVYRAKGFVTFAGDERFFVFQHMPGYTRIRPFPLRDRDLLRGVFIGESLDKVWLSTNLDVCRQIALKQ